MQEFHEAIATAVNLASVTLQTAAITVTNVTDAASKTVIAPAQEFVERGTETVGRIVTPIAENPLVQYATGVPGLRWLMAALGQVNVAKVQGDLATIQLTYPADTPEQLAERVIAEAAFKAGQIGFVTNVAPPLAISLLAIDVAAVNALQAEMIYRIAAVYGFSLNDPTRRGEVLAIWGLSIGGSSFLKTGLSLVEALPFIGTAVGIASNAALVYSLGYVACRFYEAKRDAIEKGDRM